MAHMRQCQPKQMFTIGNWVPKKEGTKAAVLLKFPDQ